MTSSNFLMKNNLVLWQNLILKISFWLLIEVIFNLIGIDELADYSEFLLMPKTVCSRMALLISKNHIYPGSNAQSVNPQFV